MHIANKLHGKNKRDCGMGHWKGHGKKGRNACCKNQAIHSMPTDFLVIKLCQLSICSWIRNWHGLLCMADFTREFCGCQPPQKWTKGGLFCKCFSLSPQFPYPWCLQHRLVEFASWYQGVLESVFNYPTALFFFFSFYFKVIQSHQFPNLPSTKLTALKTPLTFTKNAEKHANSTFILTLLQVRNVIEQGVYHQQSMSLTNPD